MAVLAFSGRRRGCDRHHHRHGAHSELQPSALLRLWEHSRRGHGKSHRPCTGTAYDVDKVISNIWDKSELIHIKHTHNDEIEDYIRTTDASEIIRVGGIDEKN